MLRLREVKDFSSQNYSLNSHSRKVPCLPTRVAESEDYDPTPTPAPTPDSDSDSLLWEKYFS